MIIFKISTAGSKNAVYLSLGGIKAIATRGLLEALRPEVDAWSPKCLALVGVQDLPVWAQTLREEAQTQAHAEIASEGR